MEVAGLGSMSTGPARNTGRQFERFSAIFPTNGSFEVNVAKQHVIIIIVQRHSMSIGRKRFWDVLGRQSLRYEPFVFLVGN